MLDDLVKVQEHNKRKRKPDYRKPLNQWMLLDELEDIEIEVYEPLHKKGDQRHWDDGAAYRPYDPKRDFRKYPPRKGRWLGEDET
ncbi:MAG: hypothetical protein ABI690_06460 [Chloroflexota bacterium]